MTSNSHKSTTAGIREQHEHARSNLCETLEVGLTDWNDRSTLILECGLIAGLALVRSLGRGIMKLVGLILPLALAATQLQAAPSSKHSMPIDDQSVIIASITGSGAKGRYRPSCEAIEQDPTTECQLRESEAMLVAGIVGGD